MSPDNPQESTAMPEPAAPSSRRHLVWSTMTLQLKLVVDGAIDVMLSIASIGAMVLGLARGGTDPGRYLREVLQLGRRSERWLNLYEDYPPDGTADDMLAPVRDQAFASYDDSPVARRLGERVSERLSVLGEPPPSPAAAPHETAAPDALQRARSPDSRKP